MLNGQLRASSLADSPVTRRWRDISIDLQLDGVGICALTAYGIGSGEWPLIVTNSICFVLSAFILVMTLLPQTKKDAVADMVEPGYETGKVDR